MRERLAAVAGVADHAALADPLAAQLELGLDQRQQVAARRQAPAIGGEQLGERDEGDVDGDQLGLERERRPGPARAR